MSLRALRYRSAQAPRSNLISETSSEIAEPVPSEAPFDGAKRGISKRLLRRRYAPPRNDRE